MMPRDTDPFVELLAPPSDEAPEQRAARQAQEVAAKRVSEQIDAELQAEMVASKKRKVIRVLILGQAESGKSTLLDNLRMFSVGPSPESQTKENSFGVREHHMTLRLGRRLQEYIFYTVGGIRTARYTWVAYVDNIDAIILRTPPWFRAALVLKQH